jgi:hypothetical protein
MAEKVKCSTENRKPGAGIRQLATESIKLWPRNWGFQQGPTPAAGHYE